MKIAANDVKRDSQRGLSGIARCDCLRDPPAHLRPPDAASAPGSAASATAPKLRRGMEQIGNYAAACCTKSPDFIIASCLTRSRAKRSDHRKNQPPLPTSRSYRPCTYPRSLRNAFWTHTVPSSTKYSNRCSPILRR